MSLENNKPIVDFLIIRLLRELAKKHDYCLARGFHSPNVLQSDLDLIIEKNEYRSFFQSILDLSGQLGFKVVNVIKRQYVYTHIIYIYKCNLFIQVDVEFDFDWWSFKIIESRKILTRAISQDGIKYASLEDASFMKFFRPLLWGKKLSDKYKEDSLFFTRDFITKESTIALPNNVEISELIKFYSSSVNKKVLDLRKQLIVHNFRKFNNIQVLTGFLSWMKSEIEILTKNNGIRVSLSGPKIDCDFLTRKLQKYTDNYNAPFKGLLLWDGGSYYLLRKHMRDSQIIILRKKRLAQFNLRIIGNEVEIYKKGKKIHEEYFPLLAVNDIVTTLYFNR